MAIVPSDIVKRLSVVAAAGDTTAGTPAASFGDQVSTTAITDATIGNIFDDVSGAEAAAGSVEYRCIFVLNNHASLTFTGAQVSVQSETSGGASVAIALDNVAVSAKGSASPQAATIASETSVPSPVGTFGAGPLTIGDMAPGTVKGVWIRRTTPTSATATNPDGFILAVTGDTLP